MSGEICFIVPALLQFFWSRFWSKKAFESLDQSKFFNCLSLPLLPVTLHHCRPREKEKQLIEKICKL